MAELSDTQWNKIKGALPGQKQHPGRTGQDNRLFVEAVYWVARNGGRWRSLPAGFGKWNSVYQRFKRWANKGIWQIVFNTLAVSADTEWLMLDSTIIRAHQCSAGAKKQQVNKL
jgi:transposase